MDVYGGGVAVIKCACGKKEGCSGKIFFLSETLLAIENTDGKESSIYLDANGMVALIKEVQKKLRHIAGIQEDY